MVLLILALLGCSYYSRAALLFWTDTSMSWCCPQKLYHRRLLLGEVVFCDTISVDGTMIYEGCTLSNGDMIIKEATTVLQ